MAMKFDNKDHCEQALNDLWETPPEEIGKTDIAVLNLLCAHALPGSETLNVSRCLARLSRLTNFVRGRTDANADWLRRHANYATEAQQRAGLIVHTIKTNYGAGYHPQVRDDLLSGEYTTSSDASEDFIHVLLHDDPSRRWGTCATFPVIVVSIGRKLGYPMSLATNQYHIYARWEDGAETFNIEASNPAEMTVDPDDYYRTWPKRLPKAVEKDGFCFRSLTPAEEFALFMRKRVSYLFQFARYGESFVWMARSLQFAPTDSSFAPHASMILWTEIKHRFKRKFPTDKLPSCDEAPPFLPVFAFLATSERPLFHTIEAHRHEWEGHIDQARIHYEEACRFNRTGNNEQRDLQRFLKKHNLKSRTGPLMPPEGFGSLRHFGLRVQPNEEADLLRRMADQFEREGRLLDARKALQDLYLFDPSNAEIFQRDKALERSQMGQVLMMAHHRQQAESQRTPRVFGKLSEPIHDKPPTLTGPLNIVNLINKWHSYRRSISCTIQD